MLLQKTRSRFRSWISRSRRRICSLHTAESWLLDVCSVKADQNFTFSSIWHNCLWQSHMLWRSILLARVHNVIVSDPGSTACWLAVRFTRGFRDCMRADLRIASGNCVLPSVQLLEFSSHSWDAVTGASPFECLQGGSSEAGEETPEDNRKCDVRADSLLRLLYNIHNFLYIILFDCRASAELHAKVRLE